MKSIPTLHDITTLNNIGNKADAHLKAMQQLLIDFEKREDDQRKLIQIRNALRTTYFQKLANALDKPTQPETALVSKILDRKHDSLPIFQYSLLWST